MLKKIALVGAACALAAAGAAPSQSAKINDAQIAHIAYTAGAIDVTAGKQALAKSHNATVRAFAEEMVRDHDAVNGQALALVRKLDVTPEANPTSTALSNQATAELAALAKLDGPAFDRAYIANEIAFHRTVNSALRDTLIPNAQNGELRALLQTGLQLFTEHQTHAEHIATELH